MVWVWRVLGVLTALVVVVGLALAGFASWTIHRPWPQVDGIIALPGLTGEVEVLRDTRGVADIYADSVDDLFFANGFVHAQDRFWEMDVRRHITAGRLSEMFGADQFDTDVFLRTMGWRAVAAQEWDLLSPQSRAILEAYAAGVNAYLASRSSSEVSLEYQALLLTNPDYSIETWNPIDSLAWLKALAWDLSGNIDAEVQRALAASVVGVERTEQLFPPYPEGRNPTILSNADLVASELPVPVPPPPDEEVPASQPPDEEVPAVAAPPATAAYQQVLHRAQALGRLLTPKGEGVGSNSWVLSGALTETGAPLLANDPHLAPAMPSLWYQAGLHCRTVRDACPYDVTGWTMSGLPGVIIGHNDRIAWGLTNLGPDVSDLVLEQLAGDSSIVDGDAVPLTTRTEVIRIAGGEAREVTVRATAHGPLISDTAVNPDFAATGAVAPVPAPGQEEPASVPDRAAGYAVALRWTALRPAPVFDALRQVNIARDWDDFRAGARLLSVPSQSIVYADVDGNIGYQAPGDIPIRTGYDGRWPVPGWDSRYDWSGFIPFSQLPWSLNPPEGFITTANQRVVPGGYPWPVQADENSYGARANRINQRLVDVLQTGPASAARMAEIQMDAGNDLAEFLVPQLASVAGMTPGAADAVAGLQTWDYQQPAISGEAAYFNVFFRQLIDRLFFDELPDVRVSANAGDRSWEVIRWLWDAPGDPWWDDTRTPDVETRDQTLAAALNAAFDELSGLQGDDPKQWNWGSLHTLTFRNATLGTSGITIVEKLLNRGPEPTGGGGSIPLATGWEPSEGYEVTWVPSMRMVVDLADLDGSTWVNLTGNSGHAYHRNYGDQIPAWLVGDQFAWASSREAVEAAATDHLTLRPGDSSGDDS